MIQPILKISVMSLLLFACSTASLISETESTGVKDAQASILDSPGIHAFRRTLAHIAKERNPDDRGPQHFYVARYDKKESLTCMFWYEKKLLWILSPGGRDEESWRGVRYPSGGQLIDLQKDVVGTAEEVGGSSYLVTKEWAAARLFDTVIRGDLIVINGRR